MRAARIIHLALAGGVLVLMAAVIATYLVNAAAPSGARSADLRMVTILSGVHALLAATVAVIAPIVVRAQLRRASDGASLPAEGIRSPSSLERVIGAVIVSLALYESVALFGLIVCLLASIDRSLHAQPLFWLNGLSAVAFLAYVAATLPTEERLREQLPRDWREHADALASAIDDTNA